MKQLQSLQLEYIKLYKMDQKTMPILIYYSFRGRAQSIRSLLCYLQVPFLELHLNHLHQHRRLMPSWLSQQIKALKVDKEHVPALIHQGKVMYSQYEIMIYLCKYYKHEQLLGSTIQIRAKLHELLNIYLPRTTSLVELYKYADYALTASQSQIDKYRNNVYHEMMDHSKYLKQICQHIDVQPHPRFILQELTLIDFLFMETCIYMMGFFSKQERLQYPLQSDQSGHFLDKPNTYYMQVMEDYLQRIGQLPFYRCYQDFLQSFSIVSNVLTPERTQALRKVWVGNPKFVS